MQNKLKYIIIGIVLITVIVIEFCIIYAVKGDNTLNFFKEFWSWYKALYKY